MKKALLVSLLVISNHATATATTEPTFAKGAIFEVFSMTDFEKMVFPLDSMGGFFSAQNPPYKLGIHKKIKATSWINNNAIGYRISGWMKIDKAGRYALSATMMSSDKSYQKNTIHCRYNMTIEGNSVLTLDSEYEQFPQSAVNGLDLSPGFYKTSQEWACGMRPGYSPKSSDYNAHLKYPMVDIRIKEPGSLQPKQLDNLYIKKD